MYNVCFVITIKMHARVLSTKFVFFSPRYITTHLPGKYTATAIREAYHLEAISHHSTPNWTVCLLHFHFPLSALSASLWDRPEKWHSLHLIEHPQAQRKLTEPHAGATHGCLDSLLLLCLLVKESSRQKKGQEEGGFGWDWLGENLFTLVVKAVLLHALLVKFVVIRKKKQIK